ncbi:whey acidic protein-like [Bufo gargarizans]|uniref:whey acidic protein-like n=1 Tax=Bufo gargarizans TaxID=30331 RepID=UPI001CF433D2|nr:whey acidic protein-like [Bufo gargarizans]
MIHYLPGTSCNIKLLLSRKMTCTKLFLAPFLVLWMGVSSLPIATENTKRGVCPKPMALINSTASCNNNCSNDHKCPENMKCCDTGCGHQCAYAERPGFCPLNDLPHEAGVPQAPKCLSDFNCQKNTKCCKRGSSRDCLPALKKKPGRCPDVCEPKSELKCSTDEDCPDNLKCCPLCGEKCMVPVKVMHAVPPQ